jgi:DNA-binding MarR family transcriptional regulator
MAPRRSNLRNGLSPAEVRDEDVDVTFMVWLTSRATSDLVGSVLAPAGLDGDEFAIYSVLMAAPSITPTELARWMAAPPTTVSSYVKRFESRGHVEREPNPLDRRSFRIKLNPPAGEPTRQPPSCSRPCAHASRRGWDPVRTRSASRCCCSGPSWTTSVTALTARSSRSP